MEEYSFFCFLFPALLMPLILLCHPFFPAAWQQLFLTIFQSSISRLSPSLHQHMKKHLVLM